MEEEAMALELGEQIWEEQEIQQTPDSREAAWLRALVPGNGQNWWPHSGREGKGIAQNRENGGKSVKQWLDPNPSTQTGNWQKTQEVKTQGVWAAGYSWG